MTLRDFPVVDAGVPRRVGVREREPRLQFVRPDVERHAADAVHAQLHGGDAAVVRRPVILHAGRDVDRLRLDVHGDLKNLVGRAPAAAPRVQRAAHRDVERRRTGDAGADRRLGPRAQLESFRLKVMQQPSEQLQVVGVAELRPVVDFDALAGVVGNDHETAIRTRPDLAPRAQTDRGVNRLRAVMEQIERPDVERPAREIDPCRRGRFNLHRDIIHHTENCGHREALHSCSFCGDRGEDGLHAEIAEERRTQR